MPRGARRAGIVLICVLALLGLLIYMVQKPNYDRARADYQKVMASDGGAMIDGAFVKPR